MQNNCWSSFTQSSGHAVNSITYNKIQIVEYSITNSRIHTSITNSRIHTYEYNMINYSYTCKKLYTFT